MFDIRILGPFLQGLVDQRKDLDAKWHTRGYDEAHAIVMDKKAKAFKEHRILQSHKPVLNTFITNYEKLFSVHDILCNTYREWLIELCFRLMENRIICCVHSDFKAKGYEHLITGGSAQETEWINLKDNTKSKYGGKPMFAHLQCDNTDQIIENIISFCEIGNQIQLKNTCHRMRNIIQRSDVLARLCLAPFVEETKSVDFTDVIQLLPMYDVTCYNQMTLYCNSPLFCAYCRIQSYHWHLLWTQKGRGVRHKLAFLYPHDNMNLFVPRDISAETLQLFALNPNQKYTRQNDKSALIWDKPMFLFLLNKKFDLDKWRDIVFDDDDDDGDDDEYDDDDEKKVEIKQVLKKNKK
eukprot:770631_1